MPPSLLKRQMKHVLIVNKLAAIGKTAEPGTPLMSTPDAEVGDFNSVN
jgi:hypothetical protein